MKLPKVQVILCIVLMLPVFGCQQVIRNSDEIVDTAYDAAKFVKQLKKTDEFKNFKKLAGYEYKIFQAQKTNNTEIIRKIRLKKKQKIAEIRCVMRAEDNSFTRATVENIQEFKYDLMQQYPDEIQTEEDINNFIRDLCIAASSQKVKF
jgi:predicted ATPase